MFGGLLSAKPEESIDETDSAPPADGDKEGKEGDVREHMVDILFSKGNLSGLQKQARQSFLIFLGIIVYNCIHGLKLSQHQYH